MERVAISVTELHLLSDEDAINNFDSLLGFGEEWKSELMQYRTTSDFQADWKIEVGNCLERARRLGFLPDILRDVQPERGVPGTRDAGDVVHRNVTQRLAQAAACHYFAGTGWGFGRWEPTRGCEDVDVDLELCAPDGQVVAIQVKASGTLGLHDSVVDAHIQAGIRKAAKQLPKPASRPALIAVLAQRDWPLYASPSVVEHFIGGTVQYEDDSVMLPVHDRGEFTGWTHVSGIVVIDHLRGADSMYGCVVVQNPWADYPVEPSWFPHARVLSCSNGVFAWVRGTPNPETTFPMGTRLAR